MLKGVVTSLLVLLFSVASVGQQERPERAPNEHARRAREQWFQQGRNFNSEIPARLRQRALLQKENLRAAQRDKKRSPDSPAPLVTGAWIQLGPAPIVSDASGTGLQDYGYVAAHTTTVAVDAADPTGNTVYLGTAYGGVWKSTNAGPLSTNPASVNWIPLTDDQATLAIGSVAIQPQPSNPNSAKSVVLVGTGETNGSAEAYYGLGILRSSDAGASWTLISMDNSSPPRSFAGLGFSSIAFSTSAPNLVVAAASATSQGILDGRENPAAVNRGIYSSNDSGVSWNYAPVKDSGTLISPASVSSVVYNTISGEFFAAISLHGIYSSMDGVTWARLPVQPGTNLSAASCPTSIASPSNCPMYRGELAVVPNRNEMYFWYVDASDGDGGIWASKDGGGSWFQLDETGITACGDLFGGCGTSDGTYNLSLAAVPDGEATDLYAGAVNLYKCTISVLSPTCNGSGAGTFLNLTHVYGCSSIAKVNPSQHSVVSLLTNNGNNGAQDVMYFANDGGIYRALDGYSGLTTSNCSGANHFDSLNETLGSITQLISFSQSSSASPNPNILLAGAQANGSPETNLSQSSTGWQNVNAGDGGYTAISPADDDLWFVSNPPDSVSGVNILSCAGGASCRTLDFQNHEVVGGPDVGNDAGAFNTPFILDPQNSAEIIVGTCRMWRGPSSGGPFTALSNSFETGGTGICNGDETNLVRAIAAGGTANGSSAVIYAGTSGTGPLSGASPAGGHVWVSTNVAGGPSTWNDQTGSINPGHFPISAIATDTSDPSGLTAYVTIMGFDVSHVWKTSDGGVSWTDFTGTPPNAVPDAPVNAVLIDAGATPSGGIVFVGTDLGVFASSTGTPSWTEVGPSPTSGGLGFLPNVAVTALGMFDPNGAKRLRVSTYGRGLWELALFTMSRPMPGSITVTAGATSVPVVFGVNGSTSVGPVGIFCTPVKSWCNFSPGSPVNIPASITMTVTPPALTPGGVYILAIHASSSGETVTQNLSVTVTGGFSFTMSNSGPPSIAAGSTAKYDITITPSTGTFPDIVTLSYAGCPVMSACSFDTTQVSAGSGITHVFLTVATGAGTVAGPYSITIAGTSGSLSANTTISLNVQSGSAFSFSLSSTGPSTVAAGSSAKYDIRATPSSGAFPNPVSLTVSGCPAATMCSFSSTQISAGSGVTDIFLTVATAAVTPGGLYTITVTGTSASLIANTTISLTLQAGAFSFSLSSSGPATIAVGASGKYDVTVTPSSGTFPNPVDLVLSGCPAVTTCSFDTAQIAAGSGVSHVFLTDTTTAPETRAFADHTKVVLLALGLPLLLAVVFGGGIRSSPSRRILLTMAATVLLGVSSACGGLQGGSAAPATNPGTPPEVFSIVVTGTSGSLIAMTTISGTITAAP